MSLYECRPADGEILVIGCLTADLAAQMAGIPPEDTAERVLPLLWLPATKPDTLPEPRQVAESLGGRLGQLAMYP